MSQKENNLRLVHFQLTRSCNLRCWFCGQWGKQGFFSDAAGTALEYDDWIALAEQLKESCDPLPGIILWGGEPLMYPRFDRLAEALHEMGFALGIITNGTLLDRHMDVCRRCIRRIYVSVDGAPEIHDSIRGEGVFARVERNLQLLRGSGVHLSIMTVLTEPVLQDLGRTLDAFASFPAEQVLLQERIFLTAAEIEAYRTWLQREFDLAARDVDSWLDHAEPAPDRRPWLQEQLDGRNDPFRVLWLPHGSLCGQTCQSPSHHIHVTWNGNVNFCTDHYDFSAGNVREQALLDIFRGERAEHFRREIAAGHCPTCDHCSWRGDREFSV